ncbi:MAG: molecular chaperone HtpG [Pseudomonadota bacterium]|nr:molecular chaperone HtpG [Pseudomonadota bacterium]
MAFAAQTETLSFQAEVNQLLHLVTHSLYSNKEIFLRELISNASDACDKLRFEAISDAALFENDSDLKIRVDIDKVKRTITITDNGIGMSREEVIENIGTIAKSGTREFLSKLSTEQAKGSQLIGQFGVGFYSAYVVADRVTVLTRRAGMQTTQGVRWESDGKGEFTIENIDRAQRGTTVILHLKKEDDEFLEPYRLRTIITKYSDHILLPIVMQREIEEETQEGEPKEVRYEEEVVNQATALWTLPKSEISDEQYKQLFKHVAHDFEDPLAWTHNKVEGRLEYTSLLYIPKRAPFDLYNRDQRYGLKLYVRRVFIMDDAEQLLPGYLRFVRGIVDSNDLPLNVSREILQNDKVIEQIRNACTKRVLDMLDNMTKNDPKLYDEFWKQFGQVLKEAPAEDFTNKDRVAKLFRFSSTKDNIADYTTSLADYVSRMKEGQDKIYYVTAETFNACKNSPHLEIFRKQGIEVLLMHDRVDEWLVAHLTEFDGKQLQSVSKGDIDISGEEPDKAEEERLEKDFESVMQQMQTVLGENKVKEVRLTHRLTDSPACLVSDDNEMSAHLQRMLKAAGQNFPGSKPILEVNPKHAFLTGLQSEQDDENFARWTNVLYDSALLAEGGQLEDPGTYVKRLNELLAR